MPLCCGKNEDLPPYHILGLRAKAYQWTLENGPKICPCLPKRLLTDIAVVTCVLLQIFFAVGSLYFYGFQAYLLATVSIVVAWKIPFRRFVLAARIRQHKKNPDNDQASPDQSAVSGVQNPFKLRLLTFNIFLRPPLCPGGADGVFSEEFKDARLRFFVSMMSRFDIICLQEFFSFGSFRQEAFLDQAYQHGFRYFVRSPSPSLTTLVQWIDGGLFIISKHRIGMADWITYNDRCGGDRYSSKGAIYARSYIPYPSNSPNLASSTLPLHLSTHQQSSNSLSTSGSDPSSSGFHSPRSPSPSSMVLTPPGSPCKGGDIVMHSRDYDDLFGGAGKNDTEHNNDSSQNNNTTTDDDNIHIQRDIFELKDSMSGKIFSDGSDKSSAYANLSSSAGPSTKDSILHVFTTHLQSSHNPSKAGHSYSNSLDSSPQRVKQAAIRRKQLLQLRNFISRSTATRILSESASRYCPIIITGDLNIDVLSPAGKREYDDMVSILGSVADGKYVVHDLCLDHLQKHPITFGDYETCPKSGNKVPTDIQFTEEHERLAQCCLDYIFLLVHPDGPSLGQSMCQVEKFFTSKQPFQQLSDHYGLVSTFDTSQVNY